MPLCAELHEGAEELRKFQHKAVPTFNGKQKVSVTTLMAAMAADLVRCLDVACIIVLDAYFSVGPVFLTLQQIVDSQGKRLAHVITRAKGNVVAYQEPPAKTGRRGRPRIYGKKLHLMQLFEERKDQFEQITVDLYGKCKTIGVICLDLTWKPIGEKIRFVLVKDGPERFILMCSDLSLSAGDIVRAYSYRFKIEVNFKVLKHLMGAFFYHFWTSVWPKIGKKNKSDLKEVNDPRSIKLIKQTTNAIEAFVNFGCIATGLLQVLSMKFSESIWKKYPGWLRSITSTIPSEETVRSVIQEEYFHNFHAFSNSAIYRIIMSKSKRYDDYTLPLAA
mgnify:CR=1 FL=1